LLSTSRATVTAAAGLALLAIGGCETRREEVTPELFPVSPNAAELLQPVPGSPWSGLWSTQFGAIDSELRVTYLGNGMHAVESIGASNALMHAIVLEVRLSASESGNGKRIELAQPIAENPCVQGWKKSPSSESVSILLCRVR
jgi:hypothetical protein